MAVTPQTELSATGGAAVALTPATGESRRVTVIEPRNGWINLSLGEVWAYKDLLVTLAQRDVKLRYRQTALGVVWVVLQPLMAAAIMTVIFGVLGKGIFKSDGLPYFVFAFGGQIGWNAFNATVTKANTSLIQNANLVSKVYFPRLVLPFSTVLSTLIDFGVSLGMLAILMVIYRITPTPAILLVPVFLLLTVMLAIGIGLFTAALTVMYRDVQYVVPVFMQMLMYATPVNYALPSHNVPVLVRVFFEINPLTSLIEGMRWALLGQAQAPAPLMVLYAAVFALVAFVGGAYSFRQMERRFADVI